MIIVYNKKTGVIGNQGWFNPETNTPEGCDFIEIDSNEPFLNHKIDLKKKVPVLLANYDATVPAWALIRQMRNNLLASTDYLIMPDYPLTDASRAEIAAYREALRNLTEQGDLSEIVWPTMPAIVKKSA